MLLVLALLSAPPAVIALPPAQLPADAVVVEPEMLPTGAVGSARVLAQRFKAARGGASESAAIAALRESSDALVFELALAQWIGELEQSADTAAARASLHLLAAEPARVFMRHEETAAPWFRPLIDPGARARSALRTLDAAAARTSWRERLQSDPATALQALESATPDERNAAIAAVAELEDREALTKAMLAAPEVAKPLWSALARRSNDPVIYAAAASYSADAELLALIPHATAQLTKADASRWLIDLSRREALASASVLALAQLAEHDAGARAALVRALDDPQRADSAAAGLARWPAEHLQELAGDLIDRPEAGTTRLVAIALALRLSDARQHAGLLHRLQTDPRLPDAVRSELQR